MLCTKLTQRRATLSKYTVYRHSLSIPQSIVYYYITDSSCSHLRLITKQYILKPKCCKRPTLKGMTMKEFLTKGQNEALGAGGGEGNPARQRDDKIQRFYDLGIENARDNHRCRQEGHKQMVKTLIRPHLSFHQFCSRSQEAKVAWRNVSDLMDNDRECLFEP